MNVEEVVSLSNSRGVHPKEWWAECFTPCYIYRMKKYINYRGNNLEKQRNVRLMKSLYLVSFL